MREGRNSAFDLTSFAQVDRVYLHPEQWRHGLYDGKIAGWPTAWGCTRPTPPAPATGWSPPGCGPPGQPGGPPASAADPDRRGPGAGGRCDASPAGGDRADPARDATGRPRPSGHGAHPVRCGRRRTPGHRPVGGRLDHRIPQQHNRSRPGSRPDPIGNRPVDSPDRPDDAVLGYAAFDQGSVNDCTGRGGHRGQRRHRPRRRHRVRRPRRHASRCWPAARKAWPAPPGMSAPAAAAPC